MLPQPEQRSRRVARQHASHNIPPVAVRAINTLAWPQASHRGAATPGTCAASSAAMSWRTCPVLCAEPDTSSDGSPTT